MADAAADVPAHITLLYPFIGRDRLDRGVRRALADATRGFAPFAYRLTGPARWPDTVYAAVEPAAPVVALHAALQAAFPSFPIYGKPDGFDFMPHVTVAEGRAVVDPATLAGAAWSALPGAARADSIEVIARGDDGRWRRKWRLRLAEPPR